MPKETIGSYHRSAYDRERDKVYFIGNSTALIEFDPHTLDHKDIAKGYIGSGNMVLHGRDLYWSSSSRGVFHNRIELDGTVSETQQIITPDQVHTNFKLDGFDISQGVLDRQTEVMGLKDALSVSRTTR